MYSHINMVSQAKTGLHRTVQSGFLIIIFTAYGPQ